MWETLLALLTAGTGGGLIGGATGLVSKLIDMRHAARMEEVRLKREEQARIERQDEMAHELALHAAGALAAREQAEVQAEADAIKGQMEALKAGQAAEFTTLKTTSGMDNYRASVRPTLAYVVSTVFLSLCLWAFYEFASTITVAEGAALLKNLIVTLESMATAIIAFYYVSRSNLKARV